MRIPLLVLVLFLSASSSLLAQSQFEPKKQPKPGKKAKPQGDVVNMPNYDSKLLHFGFFLAFNSTRFKARPSRNYINQLTDTTDGRAPFTAIETPAAPGFTTGFIVSARINELLEARIHPTVSFYQRTVEYRYSFDSLPPQTQLNQSTFSFIELPILIKYKSVRRRNTRMFIIGGIKPGLEVGAKRKEIAPDLLRARSLDLNVEYGFGLDLYYPLFKFSPEIRFSHGIKNMAFNDDNIYRKSIKSLYTHTVTLYFNFN